jgi:hypothetical protein
MFLIGFVAAHIFWIALIQWRTGAFTDLINSFKNTKDEVKKADKR